MDDVMVLERMIFRSFIRTLKTSAFVLSSVSVVLLCWPLVAYGEVAPCELLTQNELSTVLGAGNGAGSPIANTISSRMRPKRLMYCLLSIPA